MITVGCDGEGLEKAAATLLEGGVAVIPTDTVYGLAAHPGFPDAIDRLYTIKGRSQKKPIAFLASGVEAVERFGFTLSPAARELAGRYWPGGLTLVVTAGDRTEGFRVPAHEWTLKLIAKCGGALKVTSANLSGAQAAVEASEALASVGLSADLVVDDGVSPGGVASTVVAVGADGGLAVLRQGAVTLPLVMG